MITAENYKEELRGVCVIEISGESCANCLTLMPILYELTKDRTDCRLVHIEADQSTIPLMEIWDVDRVPTILLTDNGEIFARAAGFQPEEILELWLDAKLTEHVSKKI